MDAIQEAIIEDFAMFDNPDDKLQYLIDLADELPEIDVKHKTDKYLIDGCQSRVWIDAELSNEGLVYFSADADALIVKGICSLLVKALAGRTPSEIVSTELYFIDRIGLQGYLSPTRANGLYEMLKQMKIYALAYTVK